MTALEILHRECIIFEQIAKLGFTTALRRNLNCIIITEIPFNLHDCYQRSNKTNTVIFENVQSIYMLGIFLYDFE